MSTDRHKAFGPKDLERRLGKLTVGEFLHTWRVSEEMSLADFGKLVGMSVANLCDIEKGRKGVSPENAEQIAKAVGASTSTVYRYLQVDNKYTPARSAPLQ